MRTVAVAMQKGGSGKTTTSVSLAATLAEAGKRVLLFDVDPQANATSWYAIRDAGKGIYACICGNERISSVITKTSVAGVDVAPASTWLVGAERALAAEVGAETLRRLRDVADRYDVALIDTPPTLGILTVAALVAADQVLIPVAAHVLALNGLAQLLETIDTVRDRLNDKLEMLGIVPCRLDTRTRHGPEVVSELQRRFPDETFKTAIRENVRLAEAPSFGLPITSYDTKSAGADDYRALAREVLLRWGEGKG